MYVVCKLPNAGEVISGVRFRAMPGVGMVSVERVPQDKALVFASIPGYELLEGLPRGAEDAARAAVSQADDPDVTPATPEPPVPPSARRRRAS